MDPESNSPELKSANRILRRRLKPMLRFIPSQRFLNRITHKQPMSTGLPFDAASCAQVSLEHQGHSIRALKAVPDIQNHPQACLLYFHGGAYTLGSPAGTEADARRFAISCGMTVYSAQYTTAIHAPYPAAVDDAEVAYTALLEQGFAADQIVLAGTSAGGGLALALLHRLIGKGSPMPACIVALSPWVDLSLSQPSIDSLAKRDVILSRAWLARASQMYAGKSPVTSPELSPLYGSFNGSPAHLLFYSEAELFRDEIMDFGEKLRAGGVDTSMSVHKHAPHAWPVVADATPESAVAFDEIAAFVEKHLPKTK